MSELNENDFPPLDPQPFVTEEGRRAIVWRYDENPVPLTRTRPTRRELEKRINQALDALQRDVVLESLCRLPIAILKGESTDA